MSAILCNGKLATAAAAQVSVRKPNARVAFTPSLFKGQCIKAQLMRAGRQEINTVCKAVVGIDWWWKILLEPNHFTFC